MKVRFEWDPVKAAANRRKHGVSFEVAVRVFADPFALTEPQGVEHGELRWRTLGVAEGVVVLLVAHTLREADEEGTAYETVRIISARKADRKERARYEQENR